MKAKVDLLQKINKLIEAGIPAQQMATLMQGKKDRLSQCRDVNVVTSKTQILVEKWECMTDVPSHKRAIMLTV